MRECEGSDGPHGIRQQHVRERGAVGEGRVPDGGEVAEVVQVGHQLQRTAAEEGARSNELHSAGDSDVLESGGAFEERVGDGNQGRGEV